MKLLPNIATLFLLLFLCILGKDMLNCFETTLEKQSSSLQKESNSDDYPDDESNDSEEDDDEDYDQLFFTCNQHDVDSRTNIGYFCKSFKVQVTELNNLYSPPELM